MEASQAWSLVLWLRTECLGLTMQGRACKHQGCINWRFEKPGPFFLHISFVVLFILSPSYRILFFLICRKLSFYPPSHPYVFVSQFSCMSCGLLCVFLSYPTFFSYSNFVYHLLAELTDHNWLTTLNGVPKGTFQSGGGSSWTRMYVWYVIYQLCGLETCLCAVKSKKVHQGKRVGTPFVVWPIQTES